MAFFILFILHILGDFYFQTNNMVNKKSKSLRYVLLHSFLYVIPFTCFFVYLDIANKTKMSIICCVAIVSSHFLIDWLKTFLEKKFSSPKAKLIVFVCDQVIHIALIYILYALMNMEHLKTMSNMVFLGKNISIMNLVIYMLLVLIIGNPSAVFVKIGRAHV